MYLRAQLAQPGDQHARAVFVFNQAAFSQLEVQQTRGHAVTAQYPEQIVDDAVVGQLPGGEVDRHPQIQSLLSPLRRLAGGGLQHPLAQRADQAGLLGVGDELQRRDQAALRRIPAHQRFHAVHFTAARIDFRLVIQHQLILLQPFTQIGVQPHVFGDALVHLRREDGIGAFAVLLGDVHGGIGAADQAVEIVAVLRAQRDADRTAGIHFDQADAERGLQPIDDALRQRLQTFAIGLRRQHQNSSPPRRAST